MPYGKTLYGKGEITSRRGRLFTVISKIIDEEKNVLAELEGTYMIMPTDKITNGQDFSKENDVSFLVPDEIEEIDI